MSYSFTKSTNGRRYRLEHVTRHTRPIRSYVEIQYLTPPQFDDQVLGDLIRKMQSEFPKLGSGIRPDKKAIVDHNLDALAGSARPGLIVGIQGGNKPPAPKPDSAPEYALVHTDSRSRVYLGKHLRPDQTYRVTTHSHGMVVFEPVSVYTDEELDALTKKEKS